MTTNDNEWYNEWQRMTWTDNKRSFQLIFPFFEKKHTTTNNLKDNSLNLEVDLDIGLLNLEQKQHLRRNNNSQKQKFRQFFVCDTNSFKNL